MRNIFFRFCFYGIIFLIPELLFGQGGVTHFYPNFFFQKIVPIADSGFVALMYSQNSNVIVKSDSSGLVQWSKEIRFNGLDFGLRNITELNTGEFMIYGTDGLHLIFSKEKKLSITAF
ncbi:MAG: hypothetical protein ABI763_07615 [Bacteroidota bacterium]